MKENKGVYVTKRDIKENLLHREYQLYSNRIITTDIEQKYGTIRTKDVGIQYNSKRDNVICTCRNFSGLKRHHEARYFNATPKIYAYHKSRSFTDIGVGSVKALPKKKVKRIYLPETDDRGVGSSDLSSLIGRRTRQYRSSSYYDHKRTSSKCVGGFVENTAACVMSAKLSPIVQTRSGATSPKISTPQEKQNNTEMGSNTTEKQLVTATTQMETEDVKAEAKPTESKPKPIIKKISKQPTKEIKATTPPVAEKTDTTTTKKDKDIKSEKSFSSDSLVQHVYNLENPSEVKSIDMENKLEKEYRRIFAGRSKDKPSSVTEKQISDFKSASLLKRRFDALRRSLGKKEDSRESRNAVIVSKTPSQQSMPSHKDVSVTSDPPSLEGRSYSNTKTYKYNPYTATIIPTHQASFRKSYTGRRDQDKHWSQANTIDSEYAQGVKGMFKLWGKKFNLDESYHKIDATSKPSSYTKDYFNKESALQQSSYSKKVEQHSSHAKKTEVKESKPVKINEEPPSEKKEEKKKFFFFKKKNKEKDKVKDTYKSKKGVTTGRCEVRDGLMIKIGGAKPPPPIPAAPQIKRKINQSPESYEEILRKAWLMKYLTNPIDSRNSVKVRWNNKTYATSSSTIFELMENVYKETGVVFKSKSEIITDESSMYTQKSSYLKPNVNFVQNVEAWMIPTITDQPIAITDQKNSNKDMQVRISDQKWFIDKSKAFAHKIELVLHSNNFVRLNNPKSSSEYIRIDIPKGFFSESSTDQTSDEEVFKIVEYETMNSTADIKAKKKDNDDSDHAANDIKVTISVKENSQRYESKILETVIKRPPMHRDVVIQGSNVYIPKICDVIGVGIITQRDVREVGKPILKIVEYVSDEESERSLHPTQKKCEFAESYLQDYYKNWTPLGIDLFSWCISDSHLKCSSEINSHLSLNNGDGSKSCPNIFDDYVTSTIVSSCPTSSCSQCCPTGEKDVTPQGKSKFFKFKKSKDQTPKKSKDSPDVRVLPKDSVEVFKKRKLYAASNKSNWVHEDDTRPYSTPSMEERGAQDTMIDCPKLSKNCYNKTSMQPRHYRRQSSKKHVSLPNCEIMNDMLAKQLQESVPGILTFKSTGGCDSCKKKNLSCPNPKHAKLDTDACEIRDPNCRQYCQIIKKAPCSKENTPPCSPPLSPRGSGAKVCCRNKDNTKCPPEACPPRPPICSPEPKSAISYGSKCKSPSPCSSPGSRSPPLRRFPSGSQCGSPKRRRSPSGSPCGSPKRGRSRSGSPCGSPKRGRSPSGSLCNSPKRSRSPSGSPCGSPKRSPSRSPCSTSPPCSKPKKDKKPVTCKTSPCKDIKSASKCKPPPKPKSPPCSTSPCKSPPPDCSGCKTSPCNKLASASEGYPWPTNNRVSNQSSFANISPCKPKVDCIPSCPVSNRSLKKAKKAKDCISDCALKPKGSTPSPPECPPDPVPPQCPKKCTTRSKISGLFLRKLPSKRKTCASDCKAWNQVQGQEGVIRLNSREKITIKLRQESPSIEEIRECMGVKLQDEDGQTLCERRDYGPQIGQPTAPSNLPKHHSWCKKQCHSALLGDMYKDSHVNRVATVHKDESIEKSQDDAHSKSDSSVANTIEINFKLRVTQGDKTTEINIGNDDTDKSVKNEVGKTSQEVFVMKNDPRRDKSHDTIADVNPKNDINIKILIKNYKPKGERKKRDKYEHGHIDDVFANKISEKYHTVSTGYSSDFRDSHPETSNCFSIHRATIDLTESVEKTKSQYEVSGEVIPTGDGPATNKCECTILSHNTINRSDSKSVTKIKDYVFKVMKTESSNKTAVVKSTEGPEKASSGKSDTDDPDVCLEICNKNSDEPTTDVGDEPTDLSNKKSDDQDTDLCNKTSDDRDTEPEKTNDEPTFKVYKTRREEKKEMLKKVFENANYLKKPKNKSRIKKLKDMLKSILTSDSSEPEEMVVASNELVKDMIYPSLKPNFFKDSESLNNYYQGDSNIPSEKCSDLKPRYPTAEKNSNVCSDKESEEWTEDEGHGCVCSTVAARLNSKMCSGGGCCCQRKAKEKEERNEETNCDLRPDDECCLLNYNSIEYVDVEIQNSKFFANKDTNVSIHSSTPIAVVTAVESKSRNKEKKSSLTIETPITLEKSSTEIRKSAIKIENIRLSKSPIRTEKSPTRLQKSSPDRLKKSSIRLENIPVKLEKSSIKLQRSSRRLEKPPVRLQSSSIRLEKSPSRRKWSPEKVKSPTRRKRSPSRSDKSPHKMEKSLTNRYGSPTKVEYVQMDETKKPVTAKRTFSTHLSHAKRRELKSIDKNTKLGISDDDKIVFLEQKSTKFRVKDVKQDKHERHKKKHHCNEKPKVVDPSDILQLYETKKAVLEIYAEKTETEDGEQLVAKLPKFVYHKESEICRNYDDLSSNSLKTVHKRNFVMMSIGR